MDIVVPLAQDAVEVVEENPTALRLGEPRGQNFSHAVFETEVRGEEQPLHSQTLHREIDHPLVSYATASVGINGRGIPEYLADIFPITPAADMAVDDHGLGITFSDRDEVIGIRSARPGGVAPVLARFRPVREQRRLELNTFFDNRKISRIGKAYLSVELTQ